MKWAFYVHFMYICYVNFVSFAYQSTPHVILTSGLGMDSADQLMFLAVMSHMYDPQLAF